MKNEKDKVTVDNLEKEKSENDLNKQTDNKSEADQTAINKQNKNGLSETTKNETSNESKYFKLKKEIKTLNHQINSLKAELINKQNHIISLENQIHELNNNFKTEIMKKSAEAQTILNEKIKEYQIKYENEVNNIKKYALKNSALDLINIISQFENALNYNTDNTAVLNYLKGFKMFANMFNNFLLQNNITTIEVKINDDFNASYMEAIDIIKQENTPPNKVVKILKKGYKLHDVILIPTNVIVSK